MLSVIHRPLRGGARPRARAVEPAAVLGQLEDPVNPETAVALAVRLHDLALALDDGLRSRASARARLAALNVVLEARCAACRAEVP
jgi:hypothetical protein